MTRASAARRQAPSAPVDGKQDGLAPPGAARTVQVARNGLADHETAAQRRVLLPASVGSPWLAMVAFSLFVVGGVAFGAIFVGNWKALGRRAELVALPAGPQLTIGRLAPLPLPRPVAELRPNPAAVVTTLLPEWKGVERINILLLGIDKRDNEPIEGTRSDTMMLVSIDPVGKSVAMVSLPRDLWVGIPGFGSQRINVAHALGGPELAKRTITADFAIPIRYYARVDFRGFEEMADALGGVIVDVDRPVKDDQYPTEDYGYQRIYIPPGLQLMDGRTALQYARSRHSENDFGRARRQQKVLVAMRDRALQLNMIPKAPQLVSMVQKAVSTDLSTTELLSLMRLASEIDREKIVNLVIDTEFASPFKGFDGADLLMPDTPAIRRAIENALKASAHPERRARVEVLNGSGRAGLGQRAADVLTAQGYEVVRIALADRNDFKSSFVQVLTGNRPAAEAVTAALRMPEAQIVEIPTPGATADIRITLGVDFSVPDVP